MSRSLRDRRIVVTGAGSGIGLAVTRSLARQGARLVLRARSRHGLEAAAREAAEAGAEASVVTVDVTDRPAWRPG